MCRALLTARSACGTLRASGSDMPIAALAAVYCVWLLYAAGLKYLLLSALLYAPGAIIYLIAKKRRAQRPFTGRDQVILAALLLLGSVAAWMLWSGKLTM